MSCRLEAGRETSVLSPRGEAGRREQTSTDYSSHVERAVIVVEMNDDPIIGAPRTVRQGRVRNIVVQIH